jgi:chemotaxis signal transduction protein
VSEVQTPVPSEERWAQLARAAGGDRRDEAPQLLCELLTLRASDEYAVPVERVREIVRMRRITPMPRVPGSVLGLIALRGEMVQVVDLRVRLGIEAAAPSRRSRIVVLHGQDGQVAGLLVDAVCEVLRVSEQALLAPPAGEIDAVEALCSRGERFVSVLDVDRILDLGSHA